MFYKTPAAARAAKTILLASAVTVIPTAALADTAGGNLDVSATVTANCVVSTSDMAFGDVNTLSGANVDTTGGITVTCTNQTGWTASAGFGSGTGASFASRRMMAGGNLLNYNLYTDGARSAVWGDGTGGSVTIGGTGTGSAQPVTIYGRVGSGQTSVPAGDYADTVAVTITY